MKAARDYLLKHYFGDGAAGRRPRNRPRIVEDDYRPVPVPPNLPVGIAGSCLIWRWGLNRDGYGLVPVAGRQELAHRVAFKQAFDDGIPDGAQILHQCHRAFCVQPGHLYPGTGAHNVEDREVRHGKLDLGVEGPMPEGGITELARRLQTVGRPYVEYSMSRWNESILSGSHAWPDPPEGPTQLTLEPPEPATCPGHDLRIPAGDAKLCAICLALDWDGK